MFVIRELFLYKMFVDFNQSLYINVRKLKMIYKFPEVKEIYMIIYQ